MKKTIKKNQTKHGQGRNWKKLRWSVERIDIRQVWTVPAESVREGYEEEAVTRYEEAYKAGDDLPPIVVFDGLYGHSCRYALADGAHRYRARKNQNSLMINARVHRRTGSDNAEQLAYEYAAGANSTNGLPRSNKDKRVAARMAVGRPENAE